MVAEIQQTAEEGRAVAAFRDELMDCNFDGARVIEREQSIPPQAISSVVNTVFDHFVAQQSFV
ncbi:hypothetical protein ACFL6I_28565, partial [candidate division KSB1 bacterium]